MNIVRLNDMMDDEWDELEKDLDVSVPFEDAVINKVVDGKEIDMRGYVELEEDGQIIAYVDGYRLVDSFGDNVRFKPEEPS